VSLYARCVLEVKEKYLETKYKPVGILFNVNTMIYLKLKFRNKN